MSKAPSSLTGTTSTAHEGEGNSGIGGKSYQMPIVVRDLSRRTSKLYPQDASSVDIHVPSSRTKFPEGIYTTMYKFCYLHVVHTYIAVKNCTLIYY